VFMLYLGVRFLTARTIKSVSKVEARIEEKLHPHSAFMIGFVRVMGNPAVLLFWVVLAANFLSRDWVEPTWPSKLTCVAGVGAGNTVWFLGLSYAVNRKHGKLSDRTLLKMEHLSGIGLLVLALAHGVQIVWQMAHHTL
jgi:threonine/homoserine/homoserine lactone efflux protein